MDHNESVWKFELLMEKEAGHVHEAAIELEGPVRFCRVRNLGNWRNFKVKASHQRAKEFRELAQRVKEN